MSFVESLFGLSGKTALCTGATRGIGQTMAVALAKAGADVVLVQRSKENLETYDLIKQLGRKVDIAVCDLADDKAVKALTKTITGPKDKGGMGYEIDVLVNCGGIQRRTPAENFPDQDWDDVLQVNLNAVWVLARDVGRHMLATRGGIAGEEAPAQQNPRGRGKIINISSLVAFQGGLTVPAYAAAKHGVQGITKALSNEWSPKGVNVNAIAPGYIATDIMERIPAGRWGAPADFEGAVVFLASAASDYVCGECLVVDGGWMGR
ncbi:hypothetical protein OIV83_002554 [Microbotryomycetes sp. JL201]|nr:hypothetical protein OIV83_002554 [Microbotryomycetes sp. JL201]